MYARSIKYSGIQHLTLSGKAMMVMAAETDLEHQQQL